MSALRLNLGSGPQRLDDFISVDLAGTVDIQHDLSAFPWPWDSGTVVEIAASHILEHFDRETGMRFLTECARILAPGGVIHIAVPDMDKFIDARNSGDYAALAGYKWTDLNDFMGGGAQEPNALYRHRYMYCERSLEASLSVAGFVAAGRRAQPERWDNPAYAAISLYMDAVK